MQLQIIRSKEKPRTTWKSCKEGMFVDKKQKDGRKIWKYGESL